MGNSACDPFREICVIRGQKHKRIFTTDNTEYADESQSHKTVDQCLKELMFSRFHTTRDGQTEPRT